MKILRDSTTLIFKLFRLKFPGPKGNDLGKNSFPVIFHLLKFQNNHEKTFRTTSCLFPKLIDVPIETHNFPKKEI